LRPGGRLPSPPWGTFPLTTNTFFPDFLTPFSQNTTARAPFPHEALFHDGMLVLFSLGHGQVFPPPFLFPPFVRLFLEEADSPPQGNTCTLFPFFFLGVSPFPGLVELLSSNVKELSYVPYERHALATSPFPTPTLVQTFFPAV